MSLVRLQCPACSAIVKVSEEIVAQHPVVRCAKCQGLVSVATSRVLEPVAKPIADEDETSFKPKKKKKKREKSEFPTGMVVGGLVGLLVLVGLGFGIYFLVDHFSASGPEKTLKKAISMMQRAVKTIESVQTPEDVTRMVDQLAEMQKEIQLITNENTANNAKIDDETGKKLFEKYLPEIMELQTRMQVALVKLSQNPALVQAFQSQASRMGALFGGIGGFQPGLAQGNFSGGGPKNFPPAQNTNSGTPAQDITLSQFENTLLSKNTLASSIPDILNNVRDSDDAEHASLTIDALILSLKSMDQSLKEYERKLDQNRVQRNTQIIQDAQRDLKKTVNEIRLHLERIEKLPNLRLVHGKLARQLSEAGLYDNSTTTASNDKNSSDSGNPFQPANSGSTSNPSKPQGSNPFEPAPSGNGSKPGSKPAMDSELDSTIGKLTSTDHFKKIEGLREITAAKLEEGRKKEVLDALIHMFDDSDVHQKIDVFKAYKKWATAPEDKERLGTCAESLLKDHWAKKDALRFFSDNKVISATKEIARLLKDTFERKEAAETLIAIGSEAEKDVIPYLNDLDSQVRHMAIEVLARIGTKACVPDLQRLLNDRAVGLAAKQAIQLINGRKK